MNLAISRLLSLALVMCGCSARAQEPPEDKLRPRFSGCRLLVDSQSIAPRRILSPARHEQWIGKHRIAVGADEIQGIGEAHPDPLWTARTKDGQRIWFAAGDEDRAYVLTYEADKDGEFERYDPKLRVRVLDLAEGTWLPEIRIKAGEGNEAEAVRITAVRADRERLAVISLWGEDVPESDEPRITRYQVDCFAADSTKPVWTRSFAMPDQREYDGVYVWGIPAPRYAGSALQSLTWLEDELLVCAEARQPLMLLSRHSGRTIWEMERPWEFERGFVGPSCFSYYIARFGQESWGSGGSEAVVENMRKEFEKRWSCSIIGGPILVPLPFDRDGDSYSIFVAVLKCPANQPTYLADCVVYEFSEKGAPISVGKVPQLVEGGLFQVSAGGLVWRGQNDSFLRLVAARRAPIVMMGGGGPDATLRVDWFRQVTVEPHQDAWFTSGLAGDPVGFGDLHAFSLTEGGFVLRKDKSVYSFPIVATTIANGVPHLLTLETPFDGEFEVPTSNFGSTNHGIYAQNPHLLAITALEARGNLLQVTLGRENRADILEFDLGATSLLSTDRASDPLVARRLAAQRRVKEMKDVNAQDEAGFQPLLLAVHGNDVEYVKALLEAGADPRQESGSGFTPLQSAALYGSAEIVELLIDAGAEVKGNPGVMIWAACSSRQPARKVRSLVRAGADPDLPSQKGWTPLMNAVTRGNLTCVEVLLSLGASLDPRNSEGQTALDIARATDRKQIVEILEEHRRGK